MNESATVVRAIIPIRSKSKSVKDKNIRLFCGKPLFYWAAKAAIESGIFSGGVYIASDSDEYLSLVNSWLPEANAVRRPDYTATDTASSESVMQWFVEQYPCDIVSLIQVTTPTVLPDDFCKAFLQFQKEEGDSLLSVVPFGRFIWKEGGKALNYDPLHRPRRQEMAPQYMENGSFYFTRKAILARYDSRLGGKICLYEMDENTAVEIDEPGDWEKAEKQFKLRCQKKEDKSALDSIKVFVIDIDGTLTDGGMYYDKNGEAFKKFNTRDGAVIAFLREKGYEVVICTGEDSPAVKQRMDKLGVKHYLPGIRNKFKELSRWLDVHQYKWNEVFFVGDELNDKESILAAGFSLCPADAHPGILGIVTYTSKVRGGEGVLRDIYSLFP